MRKDRRHSPPSACKPPQGSELSRSILPPVVAVMRRATDVHRVFRRCRRRRHTPQSPPLVESNHQAGPIGNVSSRPPPPPTPSSPLNSPCCERGPSRERRSEVGNSRGCVPPAIPCMPRLVAIPWSSREKPASSGSALWPYWGDQPVQGTLGRRICAMGVLAQHRQYGNGGRPQRSGGRIHTPGVGSGGDSPRSGASSSTPAGHQPPAGWLRQHL